MWIRTYSKSNSLIWSPKIIKASWNLCFFLLLCRHSVGLIFTKCYEVLLLEQMVKQPPGNKFGQVAFEAFQTINKILFGREGSIYAGKKKKEKEEEGLFVKVGNINPEILNSFISVFCCLRFEKIIYVQLFPMQVLFPAFSSMPDTWLWRVKSVYAWRIPVWSMPKKEMHKAVS